MVELNKNINPLLEEVWLDIPEYEGLYQISSFGNVKRLVKDIDSKYNVRFNIEKVLKVFIAKNGYSQCSLYKNKKHCSKNIHLLVVMVFLNHKPNGNIIVVNHIDENKSNNRLENLELVTNRYNGQYSGKNNGIKKTKNKFVPTLRVNGVLLYFGSYNTIEEALSAHKNKMTELDLICTPIRYIHNEKNT
jgi:hypothetical protein